MTNGLLNASPERGLTWLAHPPAFLGKMNHLSNIEGWLNKWWARRKEFEHAIMDEDGNVIQASLMEWASWLGKSKQRIIEQTELPGDIRVSTVFLGLNHSYDPKGPPLWFETMIFKPEETVWSETLQKMWTYRPTLDYCERYTTLAQAREGHAVAVQWAMAHIRL